MRDKAIEACKLLNQYVGDLVATARSLQLFESQESFPRLKNELRLSLRRMCLSYLIITLSKWGELYSKYKTVIPKDLRQSCRALYQNIQCKGIIDFRNSVVGHIWDKKHKRPLLSLEIENRLKKMFDGNMDSFVKWINDSKNNIFPIRLYQFVSIYAIKSCRTTI
ncbi:MAG: hypothetical protein KKG01_00735 [Candidatus Omnitrophica bacterium]|nr:hypothetical protein [Candidatus Omnitrophota bacterium]